MPKLKKKLYYSVMGNTNYNIICGICINTISKIKSRVLSHAFYIISVLPRVAEFFYL